MHIYWGAFTEVNMHPHDAKNHLKNQGWTQEQAAKRLRVTFSYFNRVLNGHLSSQRLLKRVLELGPNPEPTKATLRDLTA